MNNELRNEKKMMCGIKKEISTQHLKCSYSYVLVNLCLTLSHCLKTNTQLLIDH